MPALFRLGLVVLAAGMLGDVAYHSLPVLLEPLFGSAGLRAHLVLFLGMLLVVLAVLQQAVGGRSTRTSGRDFSDAHR